MLHFRIAVLLAEKQEQRKRGPCIYRLGLYVLFRVSITEHDTQVIEVAVFMNRAQGISKGCGFVSYKERPTAEAAIAALNEKRTMAVSLADSHTPLLSCF